MSCKVRMLHFAWDRHEDDLAPIFARFAPAMAKLQRGHKLRAYVLVNYGSTMENNLHRIYTLRDMGYDPFVMVYDKEHAPLDVRLLARWCNHKATFRKVRDFKEYKK